MHRCIEFISVELQGMLELDNSTGLIARLWNSSKVEIRLTGKFV